MQDNQRVEAAGESQARALIIVHEQGPLQQLYTVAYEEDNWPIELDAVQAAIDSATGGAFNGPPPTFTAVDFGDIVRARNLAYTAQHASLADFERDMVYMAIRQTQLGAGGVNVALVLALSEVAWAASIRNLAILVGDGLHQFWGGHLRDSDMETLLRSMEGLQRVYLVVSLPAYPRGFDTGRRTPFGFLPLDVEHHVAGWPTEFGATYVRHVRPFLHRVRSIASIHVHVVFDVNHDWAYWPLDYRRHVGQS